MPKLVVATDGGEPRVVPLAQAPVTMGREPENDLVLEGPDVSRRHARIEPIPGGGWRVLDLGSKNGTYLNGRPVTAMALEFDDRVQVGDTVVLFVEDEAVARDALARCAALLPWGSARPTPDDGDECGASTWTQPRGEVEPRPHRTASAAAQRTAEPPGPGEPLTRPAGQTGAARRALPTRHLDRSSLRERALRLGMLSLNISSELDLTRLLGTILDEVLDFTGFERGLLLLLEEDTGRLQPALGRNLDHESLDDAHRQFSRSLVEEALQEPRIVYRTGLQARSSGLSLRDSVVSLGLESALCIPLSAPLRFSRGEVSEERRRPRRLSRTLGVIYLDSTDGVRGLDDADLQLLEAVAAQAAIALQNARLHRQATTDPLTELSNRGFMRQVFEEEMRRARENEEPLGVILLDLDHFKRINDTHGHGVGDEVLARVAQRIRRTIRSYDHAARWGGEEFLVLLPGERLAGVLTVAGKIADALRARPIGEKQVPVTASMGVAIYPDHGADPDELVKRADQALYSAKEAGRDQVQVFCPEMDRADHKADPFGGLFDSDTAQASRSLKLIFDTMDWLRSARPPQVVLERTLDNVCDLTRARRALLITGPAPDDAGGRGDGGEYEVTVGRLAGGRALPPGRVEFSRSSVRTALAENRSLCVLHMAGEEGLRLRSASIDQLGLETVMCVPLQVDGQAVGVIYADDTARREFTHLDLSHLELLAHQLALTLSANPRLFAAVRGARAQQDEAARLRDEVLRLRAELERLRRGEEG